MPQRYQRPYPPEFRREAVSLVKASGRSIKQVAGELGVSTESLRIWVRQDQLDRGERAVGERLPLPVVEAGARHAERPTQTGDGLAISLFIDQPVQAHRRSVSRAKKVTARFKISRSCSSSRTWRRSRRSSSS